MVCNRINTVKDPFGVVSELYTHNNEMTYSSEAYQKK